MTPEQINRAIRDLGEAFIGYLNVFPPSEYSVEHFHCTYRGKYNSTEEWAETYLEGLLEEWAKPYFNYEDYADDHLRHYDEFPNGKMYAYHEDDDNYIYVYALE